MEWLVERADQLLGVAVIRIFPQHPDAWETIHHPVEILEVKSVIAMIDQFVVPDRMRPVLVDAPLPVARYVVPERPGEEQLIVPQRFQHDRVFVAVADQGAVIRHEKARAAWFGEGMLKAGATGPKMTRRIGYLAKGIEHSRRWQARVPQPRHGSGKRP